MRVECIGYNNDKKFKSTVECIEYFDKKNTAIFISGRGSNLKSLIKHSKKKNSLIKIILVISNNPDAGGLKYASEIMKNYQKEALTILSEFPDSDAKNSLELLVDYVINRKK